MRLLRTREENQSSMINLNTDERIDDLQCNGYRIIQNGKMFCFGMDAVLLANFVRHKPGARYIDLGTGTGVIPLLLAAKDGYAPGSDGTVTGDPRFIGVEIQKECAEMASRSVLLNDVAHVIRIDNGDIKEVGCNYSKTSFDVVTSNPPYIKGDHGLDNPYEAKNIARHEVLVTLKDVVAAAAHLLKPGGSFYMVHKPFRLAEIFAELSAAKLEPKRMQLVHPYIDKEPNMVLIEAVKNGGSMIKIAPPMIVYNRDGSYTEQLLATYEGQAKH